MAPSPLFLGNLLYIVASRCRTWQWPNVCRQFYVFLLPIQKAATHFALPRPRMNLMRSITTFRNAGAPRTGSLYS